MNIYVYFLGIFKKYLGSKLWVLLGFTVLVAISDGIGISLLMPLLDSFNIGKETTDSNFLFKLTDFLGVTNSLKGILGLIFIIFFSKAILKFITGVYKSQLNKGLFRELKSNFYKSLIDVDYEYFVKKNAGYFMTVMEHHIGRLIKAYHVFIELTSTVLMTVSYLVFASLISWQIALFASVFGCTIFLMLIFLNRYVKKLSKLTSLEQTKMGQVAIQAIYSFKYIVSTGTHKIISNQYSKSIEVLTALGFKNNIAQAFTDSTKEFLAICLLITLIVVEVVVLGYPISSVFVVLLLFYRSVNYMMSIQSQFQLLVQNHGFVEMVDEEIKNLEENKFLEGDKILAIGENVSIEFKKTSFKYREEKSNVLENLSFTVNPNSSVAFVGHSGAGKTTLVDLVIGLLKPQSGQILINDHDLNELELISWRKHVGYVSQDLTIFDATVVDNITMFEESPDFNLIEEVTRMAFAEDFINRLKEGYQTRIGDKGVKLSGGQKQRLFIARELYKKPKVLLLDEATSALDSESERFVQKSIENLMGEITLIIVAHRLATIKKVDKIIVLEEGKVLEEGNFDELTKGNRLNKFSKMVELQSLI